MAIYIPIRRCYEDDETVLYRFAKSVYAESPDRPGRSVEFLAHIGLVALDKNDGSIVFMEATPVAMGFLKPRVERRLTSAYEKQSYPQELDYMA